MTEEDQKPPATSVSYSELGTAPVVYFDGTSCHGALNGTVQVELVTRILVPTLEGSVHLKLIPAARLRCSAAAARALALSIDSALKMIEQPQPQPPVAASKLN